jgi:tetratricopeptide (TPR) repeat protein
MPAAVVGPSSDDVHKALAGRVRALRKQSPFEVLGVSQSASNDELTRAHFALQRELRNLVTSSTSPETRALIDTLTQQLTSAYESVIDGPRRSDVQRRLERAPRVGGVDDLSRTLAADTRFRKGEGALGKSLWDQAVVHFAAALELLPDDAEVHAHLGWALFQQAPDDVTHIVDALARIDQALEKSPTLDSAHLFRGRVLLAQGRTTDARAAFERALACNPECEDARVALEAALSSSRQGARV